MAYGPAFKSVGRNDLGKAVGTIAGATGLAAKFQGWADRHQPAHAVAHPAAAPALNLG